MCPSHVTPSRPQPGVPALSPSLPYDPSHITWEGRGFVLLPLHRRLLNCRAFQNRSCERSRMWGCQEAPCQQLLWCVCTAPCPPMQLRLLLGVCTTAPPEDRAGVGEYSDWGGGIQRRNCWFPGEPCSPAGLLYRPQTGDTAAWKAWGRSWGRYSCIGVAAGIGPLDSPTFCSSLSFRYTRPAINILLIRQTRPDQTDVPTPLIACQINENFQFSIKQGLRLECQGGGCYLFSFTIWCIATCQKVPQHFCIVLLHFFATVVDSLYFHFTLHFRL